MSFRSFRLIVDVSSGPKTVEMKVAGPESYHTRVASLRHLDWSHIHVFFLVLQLLLSHVLRKHRGTPRESDKVLTIETVV